MLSKEFEKRNLKQDFRNKKKGGGVDGIGRNGAREKEYGNR